VHESLDALAAHPAAFPEPELVEDAWRSIGAARHRMNLTDPLEQLIVLDPAAARVRLGVTPLIEPRR
jgi:hypothetical protein